MWWPHRIGLDHGGIIAAGNSGALVNATMVVTGIEGYSIGNEMPGTLMGAR